jgi:hypothetical protein
MSRSDLRALVVVGALVAAGCRTAEPPGYCVTNDQCRDPERAGYSPARMICHLRGRFCFEGCDTDADCRDSTKSWSEPSQSHCERTRRDCVGPPDAGVVPDRAGAPKAEKGEPCGSSEECADHRSCVDGVCCSTECADDCQLCNRPGLVGDCVPAPDGEDPRRRCGGYACRSGACATTCRDERDCVATSVCDRSQAHKTGAGVCVAPASVLAVSSGTFGGAVAVAIAQGKSHVRLEAGVYQGSATIDSPSTLAIVGVGQPTVVPTPSISGSVPVVFLNGASKLTLQGLRIANGGGEGGGVRCVGPGSLRIFESAISYNQGPGVVAVSGCELTLHRNTISKNALGGVMSGGRLEMVNNVVVSNGSSGGDAAVSLSGDWATVKKLVNNTIANNLTAGVVCSGVPRTVENSIVWGNAGGGGAGCSFAYSVVQGKDADPKLDSSYQPKSPSCINTGNTSVAEAASKIDHASGPRVLGGAVDIGAFEVQ